MGMSFFQQSIIVKSMPSLANEHDKPFIVGIQLLQQSPIQLQHSIVLRGMAPVCVQFAPVLPVAAVRAWQCHGATLLTCVVPAAHKRSLVQ